MIYPFSIPFFLLMHNVYLPLSCFSSDDVSRQFVKSAGARVTQEHTASHTIQRTWCIVYPTAQDITHSWGDIEPGTAVFTPEYITSHTIRMTRGLVVQNSPQNTQHHTEHTTSHTVVVMEGACLVVPLSC